MIIYLYIKTHHVKTSKGITLKYFGKTSQDPFKYTGSGTYWTAHLAKYGNGMDTEIHAQFGLEKEKELLIETALQFSRDNNIVASEEWANLKEEDGLDGGGHFSDETKAKISASKSGKPRNAETRAKISATMTGTLRPAETIAKMSASMKGKNCGPRSVEDKAKISAGVKKLPKIECPHCGIMASPANYGHWHGDKCKMKPRPH